MKSFKNLLEESVELFTSVDTLVEGKEKVIKVVMDSKGKAKKVKTFTCSGENQKYDSASKKCVGVSGSEKASKKKGAKKRKKTMAKIPQSVKDKKARKMDKAKARFGVGKK